MSETSTTTRWSTLIFLLVWLASSVYLAVNLNKGWVPHDEGALGQSAERVLRGEIPHRDFDDPYTGGLAYIDALIFKLFGINLFWLRLFLLAVFLIWVPAVYALAREFLTPWPAAGTTLVAVAWSVPNYPAAMPSWFNLFFATFGTLALAKYIRRPSAQWLVLAGFCGGCSFLFKSVALYYVAAVLLFFVYREQLISRMGVAVPRRTPFYVAFLALCLTTFVLALVRLVFAIGQLPEYLHFVLPGLAVALLLAHGEWTPPRVQELRRFSALLKMLVPFLSAAAIPVTIFFIFYWYHHASAALINGILVAPFRRVLTAHRAPPGLVFEYPPVIAALFIIEAAKLRDHPRRFLSIFLVAFATLVLLLSRSLDIALTVALASALAIVPVLVVTAVPMLIARSQNSESRAESHQQVVLFLALTALLGLVQFPYSDVTYFCYFATLPVLLAASLLSRLARPPRMVLVMVVAFYVVYAATVPNVHFMGNPHDSDYASTSINLPRARGLRVPKDDAVEYRELIPFIQRLAANKPIVAGPDCPEIYFLSGLKNPTPVLFDSLEPPLEYKQRLTAVIDRPDFVNVVVINEFPDFSLAQLKLLQEVVSPRFSNSRKIGWFTVYWRR